MISDFQLPLLYPLFPLILFSSIPLSARRKFWYLCHEGLWIRAFVLSTSKKSLRSCFCYLWEPKRFAKYIDKFNDYPRMRVTQYCCIVHEVRFYSVINTWQLKWFQSNWLKQATSDYRRRHIKNIWCIINLYTVYPVSKELKGHGPPGNNTGSSVKN